MMTAPKLLFRFTALGGFLAAGVACTPALQLKEAAALYRRDTSGGLYDRAPVRGERGPLRLHQDGETYECTSCHDGFTGELGEAALQGQHAQITFDHGLNLRCLNCHNATSPATYVYHDGSEIPGDQPTQLCAKCHGPHYREWMLGIHGRVNGYWDERFGELKRLDCIQCHDPHRPKYTPIPPSPPPVLTRFDLPGAKGARDDH